MWKVVLWNNIYNVNADLSVLMTEAEKELAWLNSYNKPAQAWISSTAVLGMCKLWRSFGRTPNCCQMWVSLHHPSLPHKQLQDSSLCLIWPCLWNKRVSIAKRLKLLQTLIKAGALLSTPVEAGLGSQAAMREWTGWSRRNILGPWYGQGWRPKTFKHWSVPLVDYTYPVIIYSGFRALISKEYTAQRIFVKWGNLLNSSVYII